MVASISPSTLANGFSLVALSSPSYWQVSSQVLIIALLSVTTQLAYESRKAKRIIASRDISYAFTNVMANNYYSLRRFKLLSDIQLLLIFSLGSYDHFCFFDHISNSTKTSDDFAFFVFFVFKGNYLRFLCFCFCFFFQNFNLLLGWKRLVLADTPRQTINALTLYAVWLIKKKGPEPWYDVSKYFKGNSLSTSALTVTTLFTVLVCAGSLLFLLVAAICYVPLLFHIRGNLKVHFYSLDYLHCWLISKPRNIAATKWTRYGS